MDEYMRNRAFCQVGVVHILLHHQYPNFDELRPDARVNAEIAFAESFYDSNGSQSFDNHYAKLHSEEAPVPQSFLIYGISAHLLEEKGETVNKGGLLKEVANFCRAEQDGSILESRTRRAHTKSEHKPSATNLEYAA